MVEIYLTSCNNPFPMKGCNLLGRYFLVVNFHDASSPSFPYTQAKLSS